MVIWLYDVLKQYSQIVDEEKSRLVPYFKDVAFKIALSKKQHALLCLL